MTPLELINEYAENICSLVPKPTTSSLASLYLGGTYFEEAAAFTIAALEPCPRFRMALLIANLLSLADQHDSGKCTMLRDTHITAL